MLTTRVSIQIDHHVLQASSLGRGPVDTSSRSRAGNIGHVNDKVTDLAEEYVGREPSFLAIRLVLVTIDKTNTGKAGSGLEHRRTVGIAKKLSEIVVNDRRRNHISAGREVDNSGSDGGCLSR